MCLDGDMGPNMGTTINKITCATNGRKLNSASHTYYSSIPTGAIDHNIKKKNQEKNVAVVNEDQIWCLVAVVVAVDMISTQ
ncbi:hypothetical protein E2C01_031504 [Portunus trituberculatus]|uniref:Uncharacterized protein n=1 Tax=Portunus trituberculatus TaxID=210409 RepID=A0A5B7EXT1_PORTR|nr:hypothetical protein [Portunus trituberculatus]